MVRDGRGLWLQRAAVYILPIQGALGMAFPTFYESKTPVCDGNRSFFGLHRQKCSTLYSRRRGVTGSADHGGYLPERRRGKTCGFAEDGKSGCFSGYGTAGLSWVTCGRRSVFDRCAWEKAIARTLIIHIPIFRERVLLTIS